MMICAILLLSLSWVVAHASDNDSIRIVGRDSAIIVTASTWMSDVTGAGPARTMVPREVIERMTPVSMSGVLALFPSVFVKDYGGIGGLQLVSLRGGSSSQALVMLDGARLSSAQNGSFDLTSIPVRHVERIDVMRGGSSALHGANALTGAVDVQLRLRDTSTASLLLSQGAFQEWRTAVGTTLRLSDDTRVAVDADILGTRGSFPFTTTQFGRTFDVNRDNGDARHVRLLTRLEHGRDHSATVIVRSANRGVPAAVVQGAITQARARLTDDDVTAIMRTTLAQSASDLFSISASARRLDQRFVDPDATIVGTQGINVRYLQHDATVSALWRHQTADLLSTLRFDASHADLTGASILSRDGEAVRRRSVSLSADATLPNALDADLELRAAVRADAFSDVGMAVSPLLAVRRTIMSGVSLRVGWSMSFRPPTFNELYYLNYGTRDLQPERGMSVDVGAVIEPWPWLSVDVTGYNSEIRNLIVSVPVSPVITSAQNVGSASSAGAELVMRARGFDGRLLAQWSYALQMMRDATGRAGLDGTLIPYTVPELASALLQWDSGSWFASAQWSYTGYRYALPGEPIDVLLRPFSVTSIQTGLRAEGRSMRGNVMLQCDNIFDESYQVIRGYPMPGRAVRIIVSMEVR